MREETLSAHDWHDDADHAFRLPRMKHWQSQSGRHCVCYVEVQRQREKETEKTEEDD